ncbi:MFS transporter [Dysgonomonas sp. OttesenSCG-928-M03]|nr:MFS transporter [Dysgonomonas sp. OttesenSCG-928-M03]
MNQGVQKSGKLFTFLCLYIAQSIPMSFFSTILPVLMRQQDYSLEVIGLLQFLKLPWVLKFLWSPAVDRSSHKTSDYKRWIFSSELIYAVIILAISFLNLETDMYTIVMLIIFAFIASATQDIATDALAVLSFSKKDKSLVNSMQSVGSFAGAMIGGGFLLLLYHKFGWNQLLPYLALFVLIALIPLIFFRAGKSDPVIEKKNYAPPHPDDLLGFFKQKGIWKQLVFLFLYYAGLIGCLAMLRPMLVDYGYDIKEIGVMSGIIGTSIGCVGSLFGGFIVRRFGRFYPRIIFALCILITICYFYCLVNHLQINTATLHLGICMLWGSYGMATIVVYTTAMDRVRDGYEGTDFTIQTVITHLSGMIMAAVAGQVAGEFGYSNLFIFEAIIASISLTYILLVFRKDELSDSKNKKNDDSGVTEQI